MKRYIRLYEALFTSELKPAKPYSKTEAWIDLLFQAAYADHEITISGSTYAIKRGELPHSLATLAVRWGWARTNVHRFLKKLDVSRRTAKKVEQQMEQQVERSATFLVIDKYSTYQDSQNASGTASGTQSGTNRKKGSVKLTKKARKKQAEQGDNLHKHLAGTGYETDKTLVRDYEKLLKTWENAYPGLDYAAEIRKAAAWEIANKPRKQKKRFLGSWMARAYQWQKDKGVSNGKEVKEYGDYDSNLLAIAEEIERGE